MRKKEREQEISEELEKLVEEYRRTREIARKAEQKASRVHRRIVAIITNPQVNQGTENRPWYDTQRFTIELFPYRTARATPSEVIAWVRTTFSSQKERKELLDTIFPNRIRLEGLKSAEKKGRNLPALFEKVEISTTWRIRLKEKEGR